MYDDLELARAAAREANEVLLAAFGDHGEVEEKAEDHPVTEADREADRRIRERITSARPDDGWLSEETADDPIRLEKNRLWVVDPMDGTKDFVAGRPEFAVSIALVVRNGDAWRPVLGVVTVPALGFSYEAVRGGGAYRNGERIFVSDAPAEPPRVAVSRTEYGKGLLDGWKKAFHLHPQGSIARKLACVAEGTYDGVATLNPRYEWDVAAGVLLVEEAGGVVTNHAGGEILFNRKIPRISADGAPCGVAAAATRELHAALLARVRATKAQAV